LVLNQPAPKVVEPPKVEAPVAGPETKKEEEAPADVAVATEGAKETVVERTARKEASSVERAVKREKMKSAIANVGIFAELTASGSGGGGGSGRKGVQDLIGGVDAGASLSSAMNLQGANGFVKLKGGPGGEGSGGAGGLRERRGEMTEGGTIGTSKLAAASAGTLKSEGSVDMSSVGDVQGEAAKDASRDMKVLSQILQRYQPRIKKVYEDYLKRNPDLSGKMVVKFTIEADGSVSNVVVVSNDLKDSELEREILRHVSRIKFPPASGKLQIEWPMVFSAG